jgi:gliding motility associated protien GldN
MRILLCVIVLASANHLFAQPTTSPLMGGVLDGAFVPRSNRTKQLLPYPPLDESHVLYVKRVVREIPLQEKLNHPLFFPIQEISDRQSLWQLICSTLNDGSSVVSVYSSSEFKASTRIPRDSALAAMTTYTLRQPNSSVLETDESEDSAPVEDDVSIEEYDPSKIIAFQVKEDWIFDKHRSQWYCRIIGISPVMRYNKYDIKEREVTDKAINRNMPWLYFPEWRHVFQHGYASAGTFNPYNDTGRPTFLELFEDRRFSSYIIKESNVYDRSISSYAQGEDALLESERIKNELFTMEHDLWHY